MSWWKWVGLAGATGVAATGVVVARNQRQRTAMSPDDVRERLHRRVADLERVEQDAEARSARVRTSSTRSDDVRGEGAADQ